MKRWKFWWLVLLGLFALPYLILFVTGSVWLYEKGLLWWYLVTSVALSLVCWSLMRWMRESVRRRSAEAAGSPVDAFPLRAEPDPNWPPLAKRAWADVDAIARRVQQEDLPLDQPERLWQAFHEVLQAVARQYHAQSSQPELETPLPHVLWTVECVARDLREAFSEHVPGAHIFTLGDFWRLKRLAGWYQQIYLLYRVVSVGFNPVSALLREIRAAASDEVVGSSTSDVKQWAVGFCMRRAGFYAIQLYSGQMEWDEAGLRAFRTRQSQEDLKQAETGGRLAEEPLRALVLGQVKSGKSSVINAVFGDTRAAVDVVPCTRQVRPYVLERHGIPAAIILDTAGYESADAAGHLAAELDEQALQCDLILLVCTALSAARDADRRLLDRLRAFYQEHPERLMPPLVVVLTHVDQLRPAGEWNPPYDLQNPAGAKARNIAEVVQVVEQDLALGEGQVVVPVCLQPGAEYNVEEGLVPAIHAVLSGAQAARYLRCLREFRDATYWQRVWQQTLGAGRVLWRAGKAWLGRTQ